MALSMRIADTDADAFAVYRFRYDVFVEEMQRPEKYMDADRKVIIDPLDVKAHNWAAWYDDAVVGHGRLNFLREVDVGEYLDYYGLRGLSPDSIASTSITTRFSIHPRHRCTSLVVKLLCELYRFALHNGIVVDYCDCDNDRLGFFMRLGYVPSNVGFIHPVYGPGTVMRLNLLDSSHFRTVRSPFLRVLEETNHESRREHSSEGTYGS
jgi:predicted GNAT family N-acyltransferase